MNKGKYGYYPCDYNSYKLLKQLCIWHLDALRRRAAYKRWEVKQPQNRTQHPGWTKQDQQMLKELDKLKVRDHYDRARMPVATPEDVKPIGLSAEDIKRLAINANKL